MEMAVTREENPRNRRSARGGPCGVASVHHFPRPWDGGQPRCGHSGMAGLECESPVDRGAAWGWTEGWLFGK